MLTALSPAAARALVAQGARLIDIRGADEHARTRIPGAENVPLEGLADLSGAGRPVVFHCLSGNRTAVHADSLVTAAGGPAYVLAGGLTAWRAAGLPVVTDARQPIEIMRQVQITAGALVLLGLLLSVTLHPAFAGLSAFIGAGLVFAGASGWCGMALLLRRMPWNARAAG
jgi:rhodanese-related sulfurtransferase